MKIDPINADVSAIPATLSSSRDIEAIRNVFPKQEAGAADSVPVVTSSEGTMAQLHEPATRIAGESRTSLIVAVAFLCVTAGTVIYGATMVVVPAASALATVSVLCSFAFFTRWVQQVDRSRSAILRFLERIRCYIAHEDATARD